MPRIARSKTNGPLSAALWVFLILVAPARETFAQGSDRTAVPNGSWFEGVPVDPHLNALLSDVLTRNPDLAAMEAGVEAMRQQSSQAAAFPDPMLDGTAYVWKPQTRTGPMVGMLAISQRLPWFGKRGLRASAVDAEANGMAARLDSERLLLAGETRELYYELCFLKAEEQIVREDVIALQHYEELARARYATGVGLEQGVVKIQAEITRVQARLLEIATQDAALRARLNGLRDQPASTDIAVGDVPRVSEYGVSLSSLQGEALERRPEVAEAEFQLERSRVLTRLARKQYVPDLTVGLTYNFVGERDDEAGRIDPPEGNGEDDLGITAAIDLPIWRESLASGVDEAELNEVRAREEARGIRAEIARDLAELAARVPLIRERIRLFESVLLIQSDQSLRSAESAYAVGTATALDLLDAERVRLESRIATERAHTDYVLALSELAAALGRSIDADAARE